jgi:hypothetical protein
MALITSAATGNFNAGATWTGGVVPGVGDEARASNGHTITITADVTCDEVSNAGTGIFTLNDGVTLTANVTNKSTTTSRNCLQFTAASPATASIVGNVTGGPVLAAIGVVNTSTGTLNITGNCTGGGADVAIGVQNSGAGVINITGNCNGGTTLNTYAVRNNSTGTINLTGNATGGAVSATSDGIRNNNIGTCTIVGSAIAGVAAPGATNQSTGLINLIRATGNAYGPGNSASPLLPAAGVINVGLGVIEIQELGFGTYGQSPTSGTGIRLKKLSSNVAVFNYVDSGSAKTLVDATQGQMPAATDVRDGVSYASGALTGSCKVPAAASVAFGVPVDATTGTAYLSQSDVLAAVWGAATSSLTTAGSIGERLKNASTVATNSDQLAAALTAP